MAARAPPNGTGGGYTYQFVKTPSDILTCTVCFLPSKQPCLSECCGHTFCKSCLEDSKKFSNICPVCRSEEFVTIFNKQADRMIRILHIFCTNKEQGCKWQGEVNNITDHLGSCLFQVIYCPNECGECLQRQHLTSHVETECPCRTVSCQYCNDVGEYQFIEGQHKEECPKFPVLCPNECEIESIHRDEVEEHREVCPLEMIQCDYHVVGCKDKMARKDMNTHKQEMMELHLSLSINELMETKVQLKCIQSNLKQNVEKTKDVTQQIVYTENNLTAKLTDSQQEVQRTKDQLLQKLTSTEKELHSTKQQLATTCQKLTKAEKEYATLVANTDKALTEMKTTVDEIITAVEKKVAEVLQRKAQMIEEMCSPWFISLQYQASKLSSCDQDVPVVIKITEFTKNMEGGWVSKPFYNNDPPPHKFQMKVAARKFDGTTYISVLLLGDHEIPISTRTAKVTPMIMHKFAVKLLNQISDSEHIKHDLANSYMSRCQDNVDPKIHHHMLQFISYENLQKNTVTCQYLRNDTLFFEVLRNSRYFPR